MRGTGSKNAGKIVFPGFPCRLLALSDHISEKGCNPPSARTSEAEGVTFELYTEVIIWHPVGWGSSSFGHISVNINGKSYSLAHKGMLIEPTYKYLSRNNFREGLGLVLKLTTKQKGKVKEILDKDSGKYNTFTRNCGDPIESALEELGFNL